MASATQISSSSSAPTQIIPANPEIRQAQFELGVALSLGLWPALNLAVQNQWGGPSSSDKRDWFAGAVVDLFNDRQDTDLEDVETVLLQVLLDEFEVNVDDESAFEVAEQIMRLRKECIEKGEFGEVAMLRERWERSGRGTKGVQFKHVEKAEGDDDTDWDSDDLEEMDDEHGDEDVEKGDAPLGRAKQKVEPEVDDEGFTTVRGRNNR